jgi:enoyl-CoA hydratase/carnithine racemase
MDMGDVRTPEPVKPFCALLAGRKQWMDRAVDRLQEQFGATDISTADWSFDATDYYAREMGPNLLRRIVSFRELIDPAEIVEWKLASNAIERKLAEELRDVPERPVNLDPGYVTGSKLVLATTKNYAHRIYLRRGIYAEVTLAWHREQFEPWEWTYPDYRSRDYREFFRRLRSRYMEQLHD